MITSEEYDAWFMEQDEDDQAAIRSKVFLLGEKGPHLGRPHADTLKRSSVRNLKELRAKAESHVFRVAYLFDEKRKALLLIGGDKKGKNQTKFYKNLIRDAERIYTAWLEKKATGEEK